MWESYIPVAIRFEFGMIAVRQSRAGVVVAGAGIGPRRAASLPVEGVARRARVHRLLALHAHVVAPTARFGRPIPTVGLPVTRLALQARTQIVWYGRALSPVVHFPGPTSKTDFETALAVKISGAVGLEILIRAARSPFADEGRFGRFAFELRRRDARLSVPYVSAFATTSGDDALSPAFEPRGAVSPVAPVTVRPVETWAPRRRRAKYAFRRFATFPAEQKSGFAHSATDHSFRFAYEILSATGRPVGVGAVVGVLTEGRARFVRTKIRISRGQGYGRRPRRGAIFGTLSASTGRYGAEFGAVAV